MRSTRRLVAAAALVVGSGLGALAQAAPAFADSYSSSAAAQFVAGINALRASHGLGALGINPSLVSMADNWSVHLAGVGSLSHNPGLASEAPAGWRLLGENVGVGPSVSALQAAFTASPEHYANMVDPAFSEIGVAVYVTSQGYMWVTEDYMEPPAAVAAAAPATAAPRPTPVAVSSPAPAPVSVRPVAFSTPAPAPVSAPAAAAGAVTPAATPAPAAAASHPAPVAPAVTPLGSVRAKLGLMPSQASPAVPSPAAHAPSAAPAARGMTHHSSGVPMSRVLAQLIPTAADYVAHAQAPALLLVPLAGLAWLLPRRRTSVSARRPVALH